MGIIRTCISVVIAIIVLMMLFAFHLVSNTYYISLLNDGSGKMYFFGILVNGSAMMDLVFFLAIVFQMILILLIIIGGFRSI